VSAYMFIILALLLALLRATSFTTHGTVLPFGGQVCVCLYVYTTSFTTSFTTGFTAYMVTLRICFRRIYINLMIVI
jgi:hypothetical protein